MADPEPTSTVMPQPVPVHVRCVDAEPPPISETRGEVMLNGDPMLSLPGEISTLPQESVYELPFTSLVVQLGNAARAAPIVALALPQLRPSFMSDPYAETYVIVYPGKGVLAPGTAIGRPDP